MQSTGRVSMVGNVNFYYVLIVECQLTITQSPICFGNCGTARSIETRAVLIESSKCSKCSKSSKSSKIAESRRNQRGRQSALMIFRWRVIDWWTGGGGLDWSATPTSARDAGLSRRRRHKRRRLGRLTATPTPTPTPTTPAPPTSHLVSVDDESPLTRRRPISAGPSVDQSDHFGEPSFVKKKDFSFQIVIDIQFERL